MKLGVIGLGRIAEKVVGKTLVQMKEVELYAAGSRNLEKAESFKNRYGFKKAYGSYEELVSDPDIELVYICTPHSEHYENMKLCIEHKKNILCEKSFTLNAKQAEEIVKLAKDAKVFVAEAIWPRYKKISDKITEVINSGVIGKVNFLSTNLFYPVTEKERVMSLELGGGALLDVGVYTLNFALTHFGYEIDHIETSCVKTPAGVDETNVINLFYKDGKIANLSSGISTLSDRHAVFYGEKGYLVVDNVNTPCSMEALTRAGDILYKYEDPNEISGYEFEFRECERCLKEGLLESPCMPLEETVKVLRTMDQIRDKWGMKFTRE